MRLLNMNASFSVTSPGTKTVRCETPKQTLQTFLMQVEFCHQCRTVHLENVSIFSVSTAVNSHILFKHDVLIFVCLPVTTSIWHFPSVLSPQFNIFSVPARYFQRVGLVFVISTSCFVLQLTRHDAICPAVDSSSLCSGGYKDKQNVW